MSTRSSDGAGRGSVARIVALLTSFLRSNAAIYLGGAVLSRVGAIILIPLYTRRLTPDEYGEYALAVSLLQVLPHCASLGLTAGIARVFFAEKRLEEGTRRMGAVARGMIVIVSCSIALFALCTYLFVHQPLFGIRRRVLMLIVLASAGTAFGMIPELYFRSSQRPRPAVALQLTSFLSMAGFGILFVLGLGRGVDGVIEAAACSSGLMGVIALVFVHLRLPGGDNWAETKQAIPFSLALVPNVFASWIQLTADRWILTAYGATSALGTYYLAVQLLTPISMVSSAWNDAQAPRYGELYRTHGAVAAYEALPASYRRYALVTLVPALGILAVSPLLPIVIGPKFIGAITVMPVLGAALVVDSLYFPPTNYLFYVGRTTFIPIATVTSGIVATTLSILVLPRFGLPGLVACRFLGSVLRATAMIVAGRIARPKGGSTLMRPPEST
ncbi:MAG TPA: oligosaccharide flippase family protein [Labilithrix sp.]|nr:oligosaccharide flippase family protein [Labilithrix sp.]